MSLSALLKKRESEARESGRKLVKVLTEAEAIAAGAKEDNTLVIAELPLAFTTAVVNNVEILGEKVSDKDGKTYVRYALIGRDLATNTTLRTWGAMEKKLVVEGNMFVIGDMAEFPYVHVPFGKFGFANDSYIQPIKPEGAMQAASQGMAERWSVARQEGFAKQVALATSTKVLEKAGRT